jgi:hypothetical protein
MLSDGDEEKDALSSRSLPPFEQPWLVTQAARLPGQARLGRERPQKSCARHARTRVRRLRSIPEQGPWTGDPEARIGPDGREESAQSTALAALEAAPRGRMGSTGVGTGAARRALHKHTLAAAKGELLGEQKAKRSV